MTHDRRSSVLTGYLLACTLTAQNLVPNPSFETITTCPTFASMLGNAAPWTNPTAGTPELFHACAPSGDLAGVPLNYSGGFQWPRTGDGFAGIYVYRPAISEMREYIMAPLLEPLEAGVCYTFSMYVNAANDGELVCDGVGVRFTQGAVSSGSASVLPLEPHIDHPQGSLINDTLGWTPVSGSYVATGGEDHVVIGNFRNDANTTWAAFNPDAWYPGTAYLLIDDVSLVRNTVATLDLGPDTLLCDGSSLILDATLPGATDVLWSDGSTGPIREVEEAGVYAVTVQFGACSASDEVVVTTAPEPLVELGPDFPLCAGRSIDVVAMANGGIVWDDGTTAVRRTVNATGTYHASTTNACGMAMDSVAVFAEDCPEGIYLPNAFTPNDDTFNDGFQPVFDARIWCVEFAVYDRWGRALFTGRDGTPWSGGDAPNGVYTVTVNARALSNDLHDQELRTHVVLMR